MTGVAGPMMRGSRAASIRFITGLFAGGAAAGVVLAVPAYLVGTAIRAATPAWWRVVIVAVACMAFGIADLINRTPHVWRQVPQRLYHALSPGTLGLVWGFDLGLFFTTQKVVSLIWVAILAVVLFAPTQAAAAFVAFSILATLAVTVQTVRGQIRTVPVTGWERTWRKRVRQASGVTLILLALLSVAEMWPV